MVDFDSGELADSFGEVRRRTASLVEPLSAEDCAAQSMEDASPAKWHLAHTTWFFETFVLAASDPDYRVFDPSFRVLFNSYYNAVGEQYPRPRRGLIMWRVERHTQLLLHRCHSAAFLCAVHQRCS